jgi:hypothetical protein
MFFFSSNRLKLQMQNFVFIVAVIPISTYLLHYGNLFILNIQFSILLLSLYRCVEVRKCHNVTIVLGAVETTLKVTDCENVSISAVCRRLLIRLVLNESSFSSCNIFFLVNVVHHLFIFIHQHDH